MKCENCGNDYDNALQVNLNGKEHFFDSFECAIQALAPRCDHCKTPIIGHGVESGQKIFCCAHCAESMGVRGLKDRN